ncbi:MAG: hypothetical protein M1596_02900 [Firmicutes bacterium]|nr:hypothetical protein [Bacillota bacterium]
MDAELKAHLDAMRQALSEQIAESRQHAEDLNKETRQDLTAHAEQLNRETRQHAEQLNQETRVLLEDMRHDLQGVAEGVATVRDQLGRILADHEERITRLERRMP